MNSRSSNPLLPYPGLKGRVFLDYPLDILLNRECSLKSHEAALVPLLDAYERAANRVPADLQKEVAKAITQDRDEAARRETERWSDGILDWRMVRDGNPRGFRDVTLHEEFEKAVRSLGDPSDQRLRLSVLLRERLARECTLQLDDNHTLDMLREHKGTRPVSQKRAPDLGELGEEVQGILKRISDPGAIPPVFTELLGRVLANHLLLRDHFSRKTSSLADGEVAALIEEYQAALEVFARATRALEVVWGQPEPKRPDEGGADEQRKGLAGVRWEDVRGWLCVRLVERELAECALSLQAPEAAQKFQEAVAKAWNGVGKEFPNPPIRDVLERALTLRLLLRDAEPDLQRQRDACGAIEQRLLKGPKIPPPERDHYFAGVRDWSALEAGKWLDAFYKDKIGISLEKAVREQSAEKAKEAPAPAKNGRLRADAGNGNESTADHDAALRLVCHTADRIGKLGRSLARVLEDYESYRAVLALGSTPIPLREQTDWSSVVQDWRPIIEGERVEDWKGAFEDDEVWNRFSDHLKGLVRGFRDDGEAKRVLGLNLFLRDRTIGALQLSLEPPPGEAGHRSQATDPAPAAEIPPSPIAPPLPRPGRSSEHVPWTGNIIVRGDAGSGKSTLAVQIALAFTHWPNNYTAIYLALEEGAENLRAKARNLSPEWYDQLSPVAFHDDCEEASSPETIGRQLRRLLKQPSDCPTRTRNAPQKCMDRIEPGPPPSPAYRRACGTCGKTEAHPKVLLPGLSPRSTARRTGGDHQDDGHPLFWERFQQLERLLAGAEWLRTDEAKEDNGEKDGGPVPEIRLVCIDSLNTFGDRRLTRDELSQLLMLFRRYRVVGLCTVEGGTEAEEMASSDLVDVLMNLESKNDAGYALRYLEVLKSRYQHQVYGRHPFKIRREEEVRSEWRGPQAAAPRRTLFQAVKVFPSIHHVVAATEPIGTQGRGAARGRDNQVRDGFRLGIGDLEGVLSPLLAANFVLAIVGERNTYKTPLARHFLLHGLSSVETRLVDGKRILRTRDRKERGSVLLVRLHEQTSFTPRRPWMLGDDLFSGDRPLVEWESGFVPCGPWLESSKIVQQCYQYSPGEHDGPWLFELALKGGAILPEEFLQFVRNIVRSQPPRYPIRRVVLEDVALIGASYPFLRRSENAGDLFLSAFVHVMRNFGADLVMLGTKTGLAEADEMVNRACTLADEVLTCEYCDVFGERYVTLRGGGLASGQEWRHELPPFGEHYEMVPAVIVPRPGNRFGVDPERLGGLAGFGSSRIYRPGLNLCTFEENVLHRGYNNDLEKLIGAAMGARAPQASERGERGSGGTGSDERRAPQIRPRVDVVRFGPDQNETFHDGLGLMSGQPIDTTIVATVDEFFMKRERRNVFFKAPQALADRKRTAALVGMRERMKDSNVNAVPYYASVLFLAYTPELKLERVGSRCSRWTDLQAALRRNRTGLMVDTTAQETGACLLLDVLVPGKKGWAEFQRAPLAYLEHLSRARTLKKKVLAELGALQELVAHPSRPIGANVLWYSQLRELLSCREEELAKKLRAEEGEPTSSPARVPDTLLPAGPLEVCALPSGGFTGDWYIGVVDGSVSISLGHKLVAMLCTNKEEYKRLIRGVGLPTAREFYEGGLSAWTGEKTPKLEELREIHDQARSRATVEDYDAIKPVLYDVWSALTAGLIAPDEELLRNLPRRIEVLCHG